MPSRKSAQRLAIESELERAKRDGRKLNVAALCREIQVGREFGRVVVDLWRNPRQAGGATRFGNRTAEHKPPRPPLSPGNAAVVDGRTKWPKSVRAPRVEESVLKSGAHSRKIGDRVRKGRWKGMPIYVLSLEERATCPRSCALWGSCYGNGMPFAHRMDHRGPEFELALAFHVKQLAGRHPDGFVVRLHNLGDFYSTDYVSLWAGLLERFPALNVFGYTARTDPDDPIARALVLLTARSWSRFAVRLSNAAAVECSTVTVESVAQKPADAILCPAQTGRTANCGTCGLCWTTRRRIAFQRH
jgi:hypothetical protein